MATKKQQAALFGAESSEADSLDLKTLLREWSRLGKPIQDISKIKPSSPEALNEIERALSKLPGDSILEQACRELRTKTKAFIDSERRRRHEAFGRLEVQFIENLKSRQIAFRELDQAWRVGRCEIEVRRDQATARALYNREEVIGWTPIVNAEALAELLAEAETRLEKAELDSDTMVAAWWRAYSDLASKLGRKGQSGPVRVPLTDFFVEARVALIRHELQKGKPDRKPRYAEFPRWMFLYNFDRYLKLGTKINKDRRVVVETGSQRDQAAKRGVVLNGLDPKGEYKVFCYAVSLA